VIHAVYDKQSGQVRIFGPSSGRGERRDNTARKESAVLPSTRPDTEATLAAAWPDAERREVGAVDRVVDATAYARREEVPVEIVVIRNDRGDTRQVELEHDELAATDRPRQDVALPKPKDEINEV
jgi:hypothetical protein